MILQPTTTSNDELAERERAVALLNFLPETKHLTIYCARTGVAIANLTLIQQAGKLPYLSQWKESQAFHPLFSLGQNQLLAWTRKNWNYLFRENASDRITAHQKEQFSIAFMAILHTMKCIDQQCAALPEFDTVNANMQRLLELAYWYNYLDSRRFKFPTLRINRLNSNTNLSDIATYFDICDSARKDWETSKDSDLEDNKLEAARKAEKAVHSTHIRAISKKALWNWFLSSMQSANSKKFLLPEWLEWKEDSARLWFASETSQLQYQVDDVQSIEDVFLQVCTLGTTVSHAFTQELDKIRQHIHNHQTIFSIDWSAVNMDGQPSNNVSRAGVEEQAPPVPGPEPTQQQYNTRTEFIRAHSKWDIACRQHAAWLVDHPAPTNNGNHTHKQEGMNHD